MTRPSLLLNTIVLNLAGALALACGPKNAASSSKSEAKHESKAEPQSKIAAQNTPKKNVRTFDNEKMKVACGSCIFNMEQAEGCPWAVELEGKHYLIQGELPTDKEHDAHAADGMCNTAREAMITGKLEGDKLLVSKMKILASPPAD